MLNLQFVYLPSFPLFHYAQVTPIFFLFLGHSMSFPCQGLYMGSNLWRCVQHSAFRYSFGWLLFFLSGLILSIPPQKRPSQTPYLILASTLPVPSNIYAIILFCFIFCIEFSTIWNGLVYLIVYYHFPCWNGKFTAGRNLVKCYFVN